MHLADIPAKVPTPFASAAGPGFIRVIPATASPTPGAASWPVGFPPVNFLPEASGGIPPAGEDFNGVLNAISAWLYWTQAGGQVPYDSVFAALIGGYPQGAFLLSADATHWWLSTVDSNLTNPEAGPSANWTAIGPFGNIMSLNIGANLFNDGHGNLAAGAGPRATLTASANIPPGDYFLDASSGLPIIITLVPPSGPFNGMNYTFADPAYSWGANPWTLSGNGQNIGSPLAQLPSLTVAAGGGSFGVDFFTPSTGSYWRLA